MQGKPGGGVRGKTLNIGSKADYYAKQPHNRTTGWRPGCECGGAPVPCTVLDPFSGAGTTGLVCLRTGRRYVGIELNPEYCDMTLARWRKPPATGPDYSDLPLLAAMEVPR